MRKQTRLHAQFPPKQLAALKREAHVTETSVAEIIRRAVAEYLSRRTSDSTTKASA